MMATVSSTNRLASGKKDPTHHILYVNFVPVPKFDKEKIVNSESNTGVGLYLLT